MKIEAVNFLDDIKEFQKDKYKFNLFYKMLLSDTRLFYSDYENYIIGRSDPYNPIWIWTKDNISVEKANEINQILEEYTTDENTKITCKKEFYDMLKNTYPIENNDYFEMGFLVCHELNDIKLSNGFLDKANYGDKTILAKYWQENCKELYEKDISFIEALEDIEKWLLQDKFYVWRNQEGKAVSMASYSITKDQAKITHVYTPPEERRKGYCASLIHELTKEIKKENLVPLLYTDYNYMPSNESYKKVGYNDEGILINFSISKQKNKGR